MADFEFEPPSFSLGLDFDLDSEPQPAPRSNPPLQPAKRPLTSSSLRTIIEDDDGFESPVRVSVPEVLDPSPVLKRLRRGLTQTPKFEARNEDARCNVDDEIEDFSSEEDFIRGDRSSLSKCSSSKFSLHGQKVLTTQSGNQWTSVKKKEISRASTSTNKEPNCSNGIFPKLTVSPLRRFQLIDSDSDDDPCASEYLRKEVPSQKKSSEENLSNSCKSLALNNPGTKKLSPGVKYQNEDLWKDFGSEKSFHIPTPAFDEVCKEYFTSTKKQSRAEANYNNKDADEDIKRPPAHSYFFHKDGRIQKLVRDRLPNFFPLGAGNTQQRNSSIIDYMGQFGQEDSSKKTATRTKKNVRSSQVDMSPDMENWVTPKSGARLPKDAGKRRVQAASSNSGGHWYTDSDGKRVYVNKNGQELTGQIAYRHYKKERGEFKNSKKQTTAKKKTVAKKKSAPKKK